MVLVKEVSINGITSHFMVSLGHGRMFACCLNLSTDILVAVAVTLCIR